jgi:tRNA1(Val) A37 N6-methylase TrmN6
MRKEYESDYPLQGSHLDLPIDEVLHFSPERRQKYIFSVLKEFSKSISKNEMALKTRVSFQKEMRDLRRLVRYPNDKYLLLDDLTFKRNVLGRGSPGGTHTYWSRKMMWKMATSQGNLPAMIHSAEPQLVRKLDRFLDGENEGKNSFRNKTKTSIQNILTYLQVETGVGTAFPPFHARFFAERYLPALGRAIVVDPCAGWGGRLLGTLCVNRKDPVMYIGIDPEKRNIEAYENLFGRVRKYLRNEIAGERYMKIFYRPFEDWVETKYAKRLNGMVDLVITSPPYFSAENYNTKNSRQSANRYVTYKEWRENFYKVLIQGAFDLLKPGGIFVLNIANVASSSQLEKDARILARSVGFKNEDFFKLAMSIVPGTRAGVRHKVVVDGSMFKHEPCFVFKKVNYRQ